jgi:hypothetical protein
VRLKKPYLKSMSDLPLDNGESAARPCAHEKTPPETTHEQSS